MITFDKTIKDLAAEREKCVASIKTLEKLDNITDVENVINVLNEKIISINKELQKCIYCTLADEDDVIKFLKEKIEFTTNQVLGSDTITDYYMKESIIYNKILTDLTTYYSLTKDTNFTLTEELPEVDAEELPEIDNEELIPVVKETDPDED